MWTISKEFTFCAAHTIPGHPKCGRLHGHNYKVIVTLVANQVEAHTGMLLDYAELSRIVDAIIDPLDHRYLTTLDIINAGNDPYTKLALEQGHEAVLTDVPFTTAEHLAQHIANRVQARIDFLNLNGVWTEVSVSETPKTTATYKINPLTAALTKVGKAFQGMNTKRSKK
jgi:6-pyruvoyltetrahydropterin/6-carboxytetrahydropterin synthase